MKELFADGGLIAGRRQAPSRDRRAAWATGETRTALLVLIRGAFDIELRDRTVLLREPGDYVVWGPGQDHSWQVGPQETVVLTVRWPRQA